MGKGSNNRTKNLSGYRDNYDNIFGKKKVEDKKARIGHKSSFDYSNFIAFNYGIKRNLDEKETTLRKN